MHCREATSKRIGSVPWMMTVPWMMCSITLGLNRRHSCNTDEAKAVQAFMQCSVC